MPAISYIIASRDDNFCGDSFGRLCCSLDALMDANPEHDLEVVVVDWGSDSLASKLDDRYEGKVLRVLSVPQKVCNLFETPFSEVHALNLAARRARSAWIGRIDQDTIVGEGFIKWFEDNSFIPPTAYFSLRRELPTQEIWNQWSVDAPEFYRGGVGILLVPGLVWHEVKGYNEKNIHRNHMEHEFCLRLKALGGLQNLGPLLDPPACFYHQPHEACQNREHNPQLTSLQLAAISHGPVAVNDENWGLKLFDNEITETLI